MIQTSALFQLYCSPSLKYAVILISWLTIFVSTAAMAKPILIIAGPGGVAFGKEEIADFDTLLRQKVGGGNVQVVGDGVRELSSAEVIGEVEAAGRKFGTFDVVVFAHGRPTAIGHEVDLGGKWERTEVIFQSLSTAQENQRTDVLMTSCHAGACTIDAERKLPKGSRVFALSQRSATTSGRNVKRITEAISSTGISIGGVEEIFKVYLTKVLDYRNSPVVQIVGETAVLLDDLLKSRAGSKFTKSEKGQIRAKLRGAMPSEEVDEFLNKLETARSEWNINAVEYGRSLAISLAAQSQDFLESGISYYRVSARGCRLMGL